MDINIIKDLVGKTMKKIIRYPTGIEREYHYRINDVELIHEYERTLICKLFLEDGDGNQEEIELYI